MLNARTRVMYILPFLTCQSHQFSQFAKLYLGVRSSPGRSADSLEWPLFARRYENNSDENCIHCSHSKLRNFFTHFRQHFGCKIWLFNGARWQGVIPLSLIYERTVYFKSIFIKGYKHWQHVCPNCKNQHGVAYFGNSFKSAWRICAAKVLLVQERKTPKSNRIGT